MARPAWSYANPDSAKARESGGQASAPSPAPAPAATGTDSITGQYLTDNPQLPSDTTSGSSGTTYWNQPISGPGLAAPVPSYQLSPDNYLRWVNSKYTPNIASASTTGEALGAYMDDPASYALVVRAARQWYAGYANFDPQWSENFFKENVIPTATALGVSPYEVLNRIASGQLTQRSSLDTTGSSGGGGYYGGGGGYSTQQTIDLTSPTQARGLLMQTIQGALGRNPTEDEYSQFLTILNEAQTANPQVVSAAGDTVTRSGGVDPGVLALDYAQSRDDYEDRQASQYYDMFLNALAGG